MNQSELLVAIDGPAGSGKSTIAKGLAERLHGRRLDTGAIYRAFAWYALETGTDLQDAEALFQLGATLNLTMAEGGALFVGDAEITGLIRTPQIGQTASRLAAVPRVREALLDLQRKHAFPGPTVCEGRDIGTVVFPNAPLKFFLTASAEERARRRHAELEAKGEVVAYEAILAEQKERDERDKTRAVAPLKAADDAIVIDSTELTIPQVIDTMYERARDLLDK